MRTRFEAEPNEYALVPASAAVAVSAICGIGALVIIWGSKPVSILVSVMCVLALLTLWSGWSGGRHPVGGAPVLLLSSGAVIYGLGSLQLGSVAIYSNYISDFQWSIYGFALLAATSAFVWGATVPRVWRASPRIAGVTSYRGSVLILAWCVGMGIAWLNFATGTIPLLESSINGARKSGVGGVFSSLNFFAYASLQFFLIAVFAVRNPLTSRTRLCLGTVAGGTLLMTGSRSFLIFVALALLIIYCEFRRPGLLLVAVVGGGTGLLFSVIGSVRAERSGEAAALALNGARFGYGSGVSSDVFMNLQPGPRVFSVVLEKVPASTGFQTGNFALRDLPFARLGTTSDYWVTEVIMGRVSEAIGGLPPTLLGGLYLDFGLPGIVFGVMAAFFLIGYARPIGRRMGSMHVSNLVFGIACAYIFTSYYSYLSLKGSIVVLLLWCAALRVTRVKGGQLGDIPAHSKIPDPVR